MRARVLTSSVDSSLTMKLLPAVLSLTAGSVDVISFLGLGGLFTAHITGNLVILASQLVTGGSHIDPKATIAIVAGMLGVSAMAVQNALVHLSLKGAPTTAVMTTNVTRFAMDVGKMLFGGEAADVAKARDRAARTLPGIGGCGG